MKGYYIGMDGGGTGTTILVSSDGRDLCRMEVEGLNYNSFGQAGVTKTLEHAAASLKERGFEPDCCLGVGIGCAGVSNPAAAALINEKMLEFGYTCPVFVFGDQRAAMYGALEREDGILLIAGTGSICLGQAAGGKEEYRAGGFGHLIDDEGSAYALGRDILSAVVRAEDGREEKTALKDAVYEKLGISSIPEIIEYVYAKERMKGEIASLAMLLGDPEIRKDAAAVRIMEKAAEELSRLVLTVLAKMRDQRREKTFPLVLHGSVLKRNERIREELIKALEESWKKKGYRAGSRVPALPIRIADAKKDAVHGAVGLAEAMRT